MFAFNPPGTKEPIVTMPDDPLPPTKQKLEFSNDGTRLLEVMVEMIPSTLR